MIVCSLAVQLCLVIMLVLGFSAESVAVENTQETDAVIEEHEKLLASLLAGAERTNNAIDEQEQDPLYPNMVDPSVLDAEGLKAFQGSLTSYYNYQIQAFDHRMRVFEWQYISSIGIFFLVIGIVLIGLYFSWMQFHASDDPNEMPESTIEASATGFKVSSPVLGVIILTLSLAFFYLYLVYIYPVNDTF